MCIRDRCTCKVRTVVTTVSWHKASDTADGAWSYHQWSADSEWPRHRTADTVFQTAVIIAYSTDFPCMKTLVFTMNRTRWSSTALIRICDLDLWFHDLQNVINSWSDCDKYLWKFGANPVSGSGTIDSRVHKTLRPSLPDLDLWTHDLENVINVTWTWHE